jgi:beta/gamma crystallin
MMNGKFLGAAAVAAALGAILLPAPAAFASPVKCGDPNFVKVGFHTTSPVFYEERCFAGAGWNSFTGTPGFTSWMDDIHTGNNDVTFRDCNGALVDVPRGRDVHFVTARCLRDVGIRPY